MFKMYRRIMKKCVWGFTLFCFMLCLIIIWNYASFHIESDAAAELMLAKLLAEEGNIVSKNWFYSTEMKILADQLAFIPLFYFLEDWVIIRTIGTGLLLISMGVSYLYMVRKAKFSSWSILVLPILYLPFNSHYLRFNLFGLYYIPYIVISFLTIGLIFSVYYTEKNNIRIIKIGILSILSFLGGMGTMRQLVICYLPLLFTLFTTICLDRRKQCCAFSIKKYKKIGIPILATTFSSIIGYLCNGVLENIFLFRTYKDIQFAPLTFFNFNTTLSGYLEFFGYKQGRMVFSLEGVANMFAIALCLGSVLVIIFLIKNYDRLNTEEWMCVGTLIWAGIINISMFIFMERNSVQLYHSRYWIPFMIWIIPVFSIYIKKINFNEKIKYVIYSIILVILIFNSMIEYKEWISVDDNLHRRASIEFLQDNGYQYGYATFDNANVVTELTNGKVEIAHVWDFDNLNVYEWLTRTEYKSKQIDSKTFVMLTPEERKNVINGNNYLLEEYLEYQDEYFMIYSYENTRELFEMVKN